MEQEQPLEHVCIWPLAIMTLVPWIGSMPGGIITRKDIKYWYEKQLKKPSWRPPNRAFPIVWTLLYLSMGYASYLVWRDGDKTFSGVAKVPLILFGIQLVLNWVWSFIFFWAHCLKVAFYEMLVLDVFIALCVITFLPISQTAAYLMLPYLAWVTFACFLNYSVWKMNTPVDKKTKKKGK